MACKLFRNILEPLENGILVGNIYEALINEFTPHQQAEMANEEETGACLSHGDPKQAVSCSMLIRWRKGLYRIHSFILDDDSIIFYIFKFSSIGFLLLTKALCVASN